MKELFVILDIFQTSKAGLIISGNGPQCDILSKESVKSSISSEILIKFSSGKQEAYKVKGKDVCFPCFSSDPHWAILISLGFDIGAETLERGAVVYALEE